MKDLNTLPLKKITEFDSSESKPKLLSRPFFWFCMIGVCAHAFTALIGASVKMGLGYPTWPLAVLFAASGFAVFRIVYLAAEARAKRGQIYDQYLESINYDLLKVVATSPEYDQETKYAVITYLSSTHPGWSLT